MYMERYVLFRRKCIEPRIFLPELSASEFGVPIGKLKRYESPGVNQIPAEMIQAGRRGMLLSEISELLISSAKKELPRRWKESVIVTVHKKGNKTNCTNHQGTILLLTSC
jgi:hypothetical protein